MTEFDLGRIIPIDKGEWNDTYSTDAGPGYEKLDKVTSGFGSYLSLVANNTAPLTDRASWFPYVDGASIDALVVALNTADGRVTQVEADIDQLAVEVSLLDAVHSDKIKDIENVIGTMNPNQSAQLSVSGRKTISLPKNASNGGMNIKMEGLTAENLVENDFSTSKWVATFGLKSVIDNNMVLTGNGTFSRPFIRRTTTQVAGGIWYFQMRAMAKTSKSTGIAFDIQGTTSGNIASVGRQEAPQIDMWYNISGVANTNTIVGNVRVEPYAAYANSADANGSAFEIDYFTGINLTTTFGAGNEPTKEQCDAMFSDYFEGVKSFVPTGRVRSDIGGRNLLSNLPANWEQGAIDINTGIKVDSSSFIRTINPLPIVGNSTYIFSTELPTLSYVVFYTSYMTFISSTTKPVANSKISIITPQNAAFVLITIRKDPQTGITPTNIIEIKTKLEKGTKATDWTPAPEDVLAGTVKGTGTSLYLTAPELRSNGTVKDEIRKGTNGYELVKRVGVATLGSELVTNGGFDVDTKWILNGWTVSGGVASANNISSELVQVLPIQIGEWIWTQFDISQYTAGSAQIRVGYLGVASTLKSSVGTYNHITQSKGNTAIGIKPSSTSFFTGSIDNISAKKVVPQDGAISDTSIFTELSDGTILYTLATPVITPISYGGVLNSAENGTVYHEPVIADAGVYGTNMPILLTDYPIASIEEIIKHENGVDTYLDVATAVIAPDGLSFTHPDLGSGDLVLFTYAFDKESTNGQLTATFYDSNVVKIDTVTGKAYRINEVVTNGVLTRTLTEV